MATVAKVYNYAELALAAYAKLDESKGTSEQVDSLVEAGMSQTQAEKFSFRYPEVLTQFDDSETGFDATIFRSAEGALVLALGGTSPFDDGDINPTDLDIFINGVGRDQILAMVNWWKRMSTEPGTSVPQYSIETGSSVPESAVELSKEFVGPGGGNGYLIVGDSNLGTPEDADWLEFNYLDRGSAFNAQSILFNASLVSTDNRDFTDPAIYSWDFDGGDGNDTLLADTDHFNPALFGLADNDSMINCAVA